MNNRFIDMHDAISTAALISTRSEQELVFCPECGFFTPHQLRADDGGNATVCLSCLTLLLVCEAADLAAPCNDSRALERRRRGFRGRPA